MCSPLIILTVFMVSLDIKTAKSEDPWSFDDSRFEDSMIWGGAFSES